MSSVNKVSEFIAMGIVTPFIYVFYSLIVILFTFILGFPFAIGIYLIKLAMDLLFGVGGIFYASL